MTRTRPAAALAVLLLLGGCGGSDDPAGGPAPSPAATRTTATPSPSPSATTTTEAPEEPAPAADPVVDYGDDGATVASARDAARLRGAPDDFRAFIARRLAQDASGGDEACSADPTIYVSRLDTRGWAAGGYFVPQCGGYAALWARNGGRWTEVWTGQELVGCATLRRYAFPAAVAGSTCLEDGEQVRYRAR